MVFTRLTLSLAADAIKVNIMAVQQEKTEIPRQGDSGSIPARSERIFEKSAYFYYQTREGIEIGPFDTKADAVRGVEDFIEFMHSGPQTSETLLQYSSSHHVA